MRIETLRAAGLRLFLARGIGPVTIDELAKEAGMAKGNFYRYFSDKGALVGAILGPVAREVRRVMRRCAVSVGRAKNTNELMGAYAQMAFGLAQAGLSQPGVVQLYLQENRTPPTPATSHVNDLSAELARGAIHLSQMAVDHGLLRVSDPRVSALAVVGAVEQLALSVVLRQLDAPPQEIARIVVSMVMDGIRAS